MEHHNCYAGLTKQQIVDEYFIENRTKLLDVAAFLDRIDRADGDSSSDFRMTALAAISAAAQSRVLEVQMIFSDPTTEPLPALGLKSARGAYKPPDQGVN